MDRVLVIGPKFPPLVAEQVLKDVKSNDVQKEPTAKLVVLGHSVNNKNLYFEPPCCFIVGGFIFNRMISQSKQKIGIILGFTIS